jgi:asparagine synthase (glutamine-hydrolysing)
MCGIFAVLNCNGYCEDFKRKVIRASKKMKHRGPDWSGYYYDNNIILCHERLSIIDINGGSQPIISNTEDIILTVNGEIYNYKWLKKRMEHYIFTTDSDCEVIIGLYRLYGPHFMSYNLLRGMFSFVLYDKKNNIVVISRDHIGIMPLYYGTDKTRTYYSSEMKSLIDFCPKVDVYEPGYYTVNNERFKYYHPYWMDKIPIKEYNPELIKTTLENAVKEHMMSDVPIGVLLSGGLDSSLIASIAQRNSKTQIKSFCIGLDGSPDIIAAEKVAKFIGTTHYSFKYTIKEGIESLDDVIKHIESCDVTTVRASVPMYLLGKRIHAIGLKVLLTGEVSDEISGSYAYFKYAPNDIEFHNETVRKLNDLNKYDLLRANKSMMAWSIETRVPFGDQSVINSIMRFAPEHKMWNDEHIEKHYLRNAFDDKDNPYLPNELLWRKKEQFSDGVGYNWVDSLKEYADNVISDELFSYAKMYFPIHTPKTKEGFLYRKIFQENFPDPEYIRTLKYEDSVACSSGIAAQWHNFKNIDPSGRSVKGHINEYIN